MSQVIELLRFEVSAADRDAWLEVERRVWTGFLKTVPGFQRKETWIDDDEPDAVTVVIWWESREQWYAVTAEQSAAVDREMGEWLRPCTMRSWRVVCAD
ncbi:MAG: TIGR03792 family protein [Ilumatobacteraceae bacterium]|nr:TIGR03792 family protein [Ilumatobacteraceae bacterium]